MQPLRISASRPPNGIKTTPEPATHFPIRPQTKQLLHLPVQRLRHLVNSWILELPERARRPIVLKLDHPNRLLHQRDSDRRINLPSVVPLPFSLVTWDTHRSAQVVPHKFTCRVTDADAVLNPISPGDVVHGTYLSDLGRRINLCT